MLGFWALYLHRRHIRFSDLDVHPRVVRNSLSPQQHIAVGRGQPEMIIRQTKQHGIVDDAAILIRDDNVFALADLALGEVPGR